MKITNQSKIIVKRATSLNDALHYDVELWAELGDDPEPRLVAFARTDDTIHFVSTDGVRDQMSIEDFSKAIWAVPIESDEDLVEQEKARIFKRIINSGSNFGTVRFDILPTD